MNRAGIYTRLSLVDEKSTSTKRQEQECRDYADRQDLEVIEVYNDEGLSGYKDIERPDFDRAIADLERGMYTLIAAAMMYSLVSKFGCFHAWRQPMAKQTKSPREQFRHRANRPVGEVHIGASEHHTVRPETDVDSCDFRGSSGVDH